MNREAYQDVEDQKLEKMITASPQQTEAEYARDDNFSQRGSKSKKGAVIIKEGRMPEPNHHQSEDKYVLVQSDAAKTGKVCHFCKKSQDSNSLIGPFVLKDQSQINSSSNGLYFHEKCLEVNTYVRYDKKQVKWLNIDTAIKNLDDKFTCYRCLSKGATIQCQSCDRCFHGHYCNYFYMLPTSELDQTYVCIFCRNNLNNQSHKQDPAAFQNFTRTELDLMRKGIDKKHLHESTALSEDNFYLPQIDDEVVYFYQGHEHFYQSNNCFFYGGNQKVKGSTDLPWMRHSFIKNTPTGYFKARVAGISHKFVNAQSSKLIQEYGSSSSDINQVLQVVTFVELEILDDL